jgi:uncharacterized repeat protein (TIGR03806 family)
MNLDSLPVLVLLLVTPTACTSSAGGNCVPSAAGAESAALASSLSAYCMVTRDHGSVAANPGVTPYDLNTPLFSDYAVKYRTVWLRPGTHVQYAASGRLELPVGTVMTKSFGFAADFRDAKAPVKWIETRVLVHAATGWHGASYIWDDAQHDAAIAPGGQVVPVAFIDKGGQARQASYLAPSQSQCGKCHDEDGKMAPLGPSAEQLNRDFAYADGAENELERWSDEGVLLGAPSPADAPRLPVFDDPATGDTEARARAYLQANCAYCHSASGEARTTGLVLLGSETEAAALGICKEPVAAGRAAGDAHFDIVPGHPEQSILVHRMQATEPGVAMPELGRSLEHVEAVQIVSDWISQMDGGCAD